MTITHGSLFTGIGGFELGFGAAGIETRWASEIDKYCNRVLAAKLPEVPNYGDITQLRNAGAIDVISFGSPCQDLSVAGRRAGFEGARSGLFFEAARVIDECKPAFAVWENVPGAFSSNVGRDFFAAVDILVQLGARDVAWRVFDSQYAGVPQQRRRVYLVADFRGERAAEVLFDADSCSGHPAPLGEARQSLASTLAAGAYRSGRPGGSHDTDLVYGSWSEAADLEGPHGFGQPLAKSHALGAAGGGLDVGAHKGSLVVENARTVTSKWAKGAGGPAGDETQNLVPVAVMHPDAVHRDGVALQDSPDAEGRKRKRNAGKGIRDDGQSFTLNAGEPPVAFLPRHYTRGKDGAPSAQ